MLDHRGMAQGGVRAADLVGDVGVRLGQALDVRLVDDRLVIRVPRRAVLLPVEERVDHHGLHRVRCRVVGVALLGVLEGVGEARWRPVDAAFERLGVGIDQQLARVAAVAVLRLVGPVHPVAVALAGRDPGQVGVPDQRVALGHRDPGLAAVVVEQAQLHGLGDLGEERKVRASAVVRGSERVRAAWPDFHRSPRWAGGQVTGCNAGSGIAVRAHPDADHSPVQPVPPTEAGSSHRARVRSWSTRRPSRRSPRTAAWSRARSADRS